MSDRLSDLATAIKGDDSPDIGTLAKLQEILGGSRSGQQRFHIEIGSPQFRGEIRAGQVLGIKLEVKLGGL